ncbi:TOMM precursor leader peptide-binding protein [Nonomuraea sp. NPDC050536]|uniref:TOMM precursor leader peptide-binding protein n=1 Tax=Nonomuraea sp. NPDC050536 TaxID=3364366 RepID=UPI0037C8E222
MAPAVPVTDPPRPALLAAGPFGRSVTGLLAAEFDGARTLATADELRDTAPLVVALWRPAEALCQRVDDLAHGRGSAWLPVIREQASILVGPWMGPGTGACFRCYRDRRRQHDREGNSTDALHAAYDRDETCGPGGFLPQHARVAAGVAGALLRDGPSAGTRVIKISLSGLSVRSDRLTPCHGCSRCDARMPERDLRVLFRLTEEVVADGR